MDSFTRTFHVSDVEIYTVHMHLETLHSTKGRGSGEEGLLHARIHMKNFHDTTRLSFYSHRMFFQFLLVSSQSCFPYYTKQSDSAGQQGLLWCREFFSQCDCVAISSSRSDLTLSEAETQIALIINQAELFGVSRICRDSFVSLYCHQVYTEVQQPMNVEQDQILAPSDQQVCLEDCERVISTDCGDNNWNILSNVVAQFIERDSIQLPTLRQLVDCVVLEPTIGGTGMERNESVSCLSLQPCMLTS